MGFVKAGEGWKNDQRRAQKNISTFFQKTLDK
jgi:hypothetical protein